MSKATLEVCVISRQGQPFLLECCSTAAGSTTQFMLMNLAKKPNSMSFLHWPPMYSVTARDSTCWTADIFDTVLDFNSSFSIIITLTQTAQHQYYLSCVSYFQPLAIIWHYLDCASVSLPMHQVNSFFSEDVYTIAASTESYVQSLPESVTAAALALFLTSIWAKILNS